MSVLFLRRSRLFCGYASFSAILSGTFLSFSQQALASTDDDRDIVAIRAEMRRLEDRLKAIERRRSVAVVPVVREGSRTRVPPRRVLVTDADVARSAREKGERDALVPVQRFAPMRNEARRTVIDLSSASPLAITQTSVDSLAPVFRIGDISVRLGGFIDMSAVWRSANMSSGPATGWNNFPYANNPDHHLSETRFSAQLSRLSALLEANPSQSVRLQAYIESDFGGSAGTTNSVQISGYTPRLRQGYFTFTQKDWGFHLLMGQAWSLATNYRKGVLPRQEQLPAVTDNNQIPGITFTRVPQIRIGKDWQEKYWLALSVEDPQNTFGFSQALPSGGVMPAAYGQAQGTKVYYGNKGGVLLNPNVSYSYNPAPDIILKGAVDTSFGHYEVFGLGRWFRDLVLPAGSGQSHHNTHFGGGVGGGLTVPLGTQALQLTGNVLAGQGVGRYGPSLIPDTTLNGQGGLSPVPEVMGALGLIGHPAKTVLLYTYGGVEAAGRNRYIGLNGAQYGYGVKDLNLAGCSVEFGDCAAQTRTLASFTSGGWWYLMGGAYGNVMAGVQYTYIRKFAFAGVDEHGDAVHPTTYGHTAYVTFRYLPFQ